MEHAKSRTVESYEANAQEFSQRFMDLTRLLVQDELPYFQSHLKGKDVLDLGAGPGHNADFLKSRGFDLTCIDISPAMVQACKSRGLRAYVMDIEDLAFKEDSFDGIIAVTSLLHIPKVRLRPAIGRISAILKRGGMIYVCLKEGDGEGMEQDSINQGTQRFFSYYREGEIRDMFNMLRFERSTRIELGKSVFLSLFFTRP